MRLGPGDFFGKPFHLTSFQRRWVYRLFEYWLTDGEHHNGEHRAGQYRYKRATFGTAKGNGKTPFEGALGAEGLAGPTAPVSPLVLVAASALVQSNLVFGDLRAGITHDDSPLKPFIEDFELSIQLRDGPGEIKRVAAVAGSNDGPRATRLLADELHEWTGRLGDVFDVLDGSIGKRENAFTVGISTAGSNKETLLGRQYSRGVAIATGEITDDETLFEWYESPDENNALGVPALTVPERIVTAADLEQWRRAIAPANPALFEGGYLRESYIRSRFDGAQAIERFKWERYHLNRWTASEEKWLPPGKWAESGRRGGLTPRAPIALAFVGDYEGQSAGLIAVDASTRFLQRLGVWEPPVDGSEQQKADYEVPRHEVRAAVADAFATYDVKRFFVNPNGWHGEAADWAEAYNSRRESVVVEFDWMRMAKRKHDACSKFYTSVTTGELTHAEDPALARHLDSARPRETAEGSWIERQGRSGPPIVLAVASVLAWDAVSALPRARKTTGRLVTF